MVMSDQIRKSNDANNFSIFDNWQPAHIFIYDGVDVIIGMAGNNSSYHYFADRAFKCRIGSQRFI